MSRTSKSPRTVALEALAAGEVALPLYSHPCSPKKFTQPQLFACLVLKAFFRTATAASSPSSTTAPTW